MAQQDLQTLETELEEGRALHARQHREIAALREERDLALQRACAAKVEADALDVRLNTLTVEYDGLAEELQSTRLRTQEAESAASRTQREFQDYRCQVGERETDTLQHVTAQLVEAKTSHLTEFAQLKKAHAEELSRMRAQCEETLAHRIREVEERHVMDMTAVQKQLQDRTSELAVVQDEYDQARQERATLQLRFSAQEAQSLKQQQEIKQLQQQLRAGGHGGGPHGREVDYTQPGRFYQGDEQPARDIHNGIGSIDYPPSPMFSEDLGAASFSYPNSPVNTSHAFGPRAVFRSEEFAPHDFQQRNRHVPEREAFGAWGESKTGGVYANAQNDERDSGEYSASAQDQRVDTLMDENERLKRIVKEVLFVMLAPVLTSVCSITVSVGSLLIMNALLLDSLLLSALTKFTHVVDAQRSGAAARANGAEQQHSQRADSSTSGSRPAVTHLIQPPHPSAPAASVQLGGACVERHPAQRGEQPQLQLHAGQHGRQ